MSDFHIDCRPQWVVQLKGCSDWNQARRVNKQKVSKIPRRPSPDSGHGAVSIILFLIWFAETNLASGSNRYTGNYRLAEEKHKLLQRERERKIVELVRGGHEIYGQISHPGRSLKRSDAGECFLSRLNLFSCQKQHYMFLIHFHSLDCVHIW